MQKSRGQINRSFRETIILLTRNPGNSLHASIPLQKSSISKCKRLVLNNDAKKRPYPISGDLFQYARVFVFPNLFLFIGTFPGVKNMNVRHGFMKYKATEGFINDGDSSRKRMGETKVH